MARLYLPPPLYAHLMPHFETLGGLVGSALDGEAAAADRNPPQLHHRNRRGEDVQHIEYHPAYLSMTRRAFSDYGFAAMSHRPGCWAGLPPCQRQRNTP